MYSFPSNSQSRDKKEVEPLFWNWDTSR